MVYLMGNFLDVVKKHQLWNCWKNRVKVDKAKDVYERERDMELTFFFHRVADYATKEFLKKEKSHGHSSWWGQAQTKNNFVNGDYLHYELKEALLSVVDTQSAGKEGLNELLAKSSETIKNLCLPVEKTSSSTIFSRIK